MTTTTLSYNGMEFAVPQFGGEGIALRGIRPEGAIPSGHPIVQSVHTVWDLRNFGTPRSPIVIGEIEDQDGFANPGPMALRTLDMPIKFPNTGYRLPAELYQFKEPLEKMIGFEHAINRYVDEYHAYLTVDFGKVKAGRTQRRCGCHVDGFQGQRINPKNPINRSYVVASAAPTIFYVHPFETGHLDDRFDNFFLEFDRQSDESRTTRPSSFQILLMDAYTVHRAGAVTADIFRVFLRLSYDVLEFDRLGNAHNPLFDYSWEMIVREAQKSLS